MATLSEYFQAEARDQLIGMERSLGHEGTPDHAELHRAARTIRGSAQMAREDRVFRAASTLEAAARALVAGAMQWNSDIAQRAHATLGDLRSLVDRSGDDHALDARLDAILQRWAEVGIHPAASAGAAGDGSNEFREFAAHEVAGIADALDRGVQQLSADPMDREALRNILRRQRALLGAARLDEIPVVAEMLRAVEDLTRVIAKLDIGVKQDWLDIYRVARDGLKGAVEPLHLNEDPAPSNALSRLRHMREELLERYGTGEAVSAAHEARGLVQAAAMQEPPQPVALPADDHDHHHGADRDNADLVDAPDGDVPLLELTVDDAVIDLEDDHGDDLPLLELAADDIIELAEDDVVPESDFDEDDGPDLLAAAAGAIQRAGAAGAAAADTLDAAQQVAQRLAEQAANRVQRAVQEAAQGVSQVMQAAAAAGLGVAGSATPAGDDAAGDDASGSDDAVPIEQLCYRGDAALERAGELRDVLERVAAHDPQARDAVAELFDLIRLART
jgi:chemotaxis protein histidine kinase CheA